MVARFAAGASEQHAPRYAMHHPVTSHDATEDTMRYASETFVSQTAHLGRKVDLDSHVTAQQDGIGDRRSACLLSRDFSNLLLSVSSLRSTRPRSPLQNDPRQVEGEPIGTKVHCCRHEFRVPAGFAQAHLPGCNVPVSPAKSPAAPRPGHLVGGRPGHAQVVRCAEDIAERCRDKGSRSVGRVFGHGEQA